MESQLPMPNPSPEMGGYHRREVQPLTPEQLPQKSPEKRSDHGETMETAPRQIPAEPIIIPAVPALSILPTPDPTATMKARTTGSSSSNNPSVAPDEDSMKEWVTKAKNIVNQTKDDPYVQEREVSKLQADYIKKRYGKDVKIASE